MEEEAGVQAWVAITCRTQKKKNAQKKKNIEETMRYIAINFAILL